MAWRKLAYTVAGLGTWGLASARTIPPGRQAVAHPGPGTRLATSGDAYVHEIRTSDGIQWHFGTSRGERRIQLRAGRLTLLAFTDRDTRHEDVQGPSDVLSFVWNDRPLTGRSTPWVLDKVTTRRLPQGELLFQLALHTTGVAIVKSYVLYPRESIVQEWLTISNRSGSPVQLDAPASLDMQILQREAADLDLTTMSGDDSWKLSTTPLPADSVRTVTGGTPILVLQNHTTRRGVFIGWDYLGVYHLTVGRVAGESVHVDFVTTYGTTLAPGETVELPKVFTGTFRGDFDDMAHELTDYQYRYKWDYTRDAYFPRTGVQGYWGAGSSYAEAPMGTKGKFDPVSTYRKVFHLVDLMRAVGGELYWRDAGWWDNEGDWNGPNWAETKRYLSQYGMDQILYIPIQDAAPESRVAQEHPDWIKGHATMSGWMLDQSHPAVIDWELRVLDSKQRQWGDFQWRKDWSFLGGTPSQRLRQDQDYRRLLRTFLDRHPGMGYYGCIDIGYEMVRLANTWGIASVPDPPAGEELPGDAWAHQPAYGISYVFPTDKFEEGLLDPQHYEKVTARRLLSNRTPLIGDTEDPDKLEGVRQLIDINHYLRYKKVVGRWAWAYHPSVTGDGADWYMERLSGDHRRGIIVLGHPVRKPVTIYPKGLLPHESYNVSYQESEKTDNRSGTDLMAHGILLPSVPVGEVLYLNLPLHPGSAADRTPPTPPSHVTQQVATHMDYVGVELSWRPAHDNNWISYYQIARNGVPIGITATGTYYFDHALGTDPAAHYTVTAVDGSGNRSTPAAAAGVVGPAALVLDDTSSALRYTGNGWQHQTQQWSVANGTQARTNTPGDAVTLTFTGRQVTWYGRMGRDKGIAAVYLDGRLDRLVDTYAADEMANIALYSRVFPAVGEHTLAIVATSAQSGVARSAQTDSTQHWIVIDGIQVEQTPLLLADRMPRGGIAYRGLGWWPSPGEPGTSPSAPMLPAERARVSSRAGDRVEYTFTGRGITWVGRRCSTCGVADVYMDGRLVTSADTYVAPVRADTLHGDEQRNVPLFTRQWPVRGRHTLTLVVRPVANLWAKGHAVYLDALYVTP